MTSTGAIGGSLAAGSNSSVTATAGRLDFLLAFLLAGLLAFFAAGLLAFFAAGTSRLGAGGRLDRSAAGSLAVGLLAAFLLDVLLAFFAAGSSRTCAGSLAGARLDFLLVCMIGGLPTAGSEVALAAFLLEAFLLVPTTGAGWPVVG